MSIKLNTFATDWGNMLQAYSSNTPFKSASGDVVKVNSGCKIILSDPCRVFFDLKRGVLKRRDIAHISIHLSEKLELVEILEKISQSFECINDQLHQKFENLSPHKNLSVRFSNWFTPLWWNRPLLAKILIVVTFGIFYFIWKRGRVIEKRYNSLSTSLGQFHSFSQLINERANIRRKKDDLVLSINTNKEALPLSVMGIIFNYLEYGERIVVKGWDVAERAMEVSRSFQSELIQKYIKLFDPLKDSFKKELDLIKDLEEYFKWHPIPVETSKEETEHAIIVRILDIFGVSEFRSLFYSVVMNFNSFDSQTAKKIRRPLQYKEFALFLVGIAPAVLEYVPKDIPSYREIVLEAVSKWGYTLKYASKELQKDREIVQKAIKNYGGALEFATELQNDKEVVLQAVESSGYTLRYASKELQNDKEVVLKAISSDSSALQYASPDLKRDVEVVLKVLDNNFKDFFGYADPEVYKDRKVLLLALSMDLNCELWSTTIVNAYREDKEVIYAAVGANGKALGWVSEEFRNDPELILLGLKTNDESICYASAGLLNSREFILKAVGVNGYALRWVQEVFRYDPEIVLKGLETDDRALAFTSDKLKKDQDFVQKAVQKQKSAIRFASDEIPAYKQMVLDVLEQEPLVMEFLPEKVKEKPFLIKAIQRNENVFNHLSKIHQQDHDLFQVYWTKRTGSNLGM